MNHYSDAEAAATQDVMRKLLEVLIASGAGHSVVINALSNLACNFARKHPCCTQGAGLMFIELGTNLVFCSQPSAATPTAAPPGTHLH